MSCADHFDWHRHGFYWALSLPYWGGVRLGRSDVEMEKGLASANPLYFLKQHSFVGTNTDP